MAEPLKDSFGPDVPVRIAEMVGGADPRFDREEFLRVSLDGYESLELTPRARQISAALAQTLPSDPELALGILMDSLGPEMGKSELTGMGTFLYLPFVFFVAERGLDSFEASMKAQYELTKRFTAEFSIRAFLERHPDRTLERLGEWTLDPDPHVRRLVSEGTRPRLPWAPRLRAFQEDPSRILDLLEALKDDPEELVRRSVANNLNDISKDHPEVVVEVARRWWADAGEQRKGLIRHALRSLVKAGHAEALAVLGYRADSPVVVRRVACSPETARIGEKVRIEVELENPSEDEAAALVDFRVHFVKARGSLSPKVFKGAQVSPEPGGRALIRKSISLAQQSTRRHYPGDHRVEVMVNGTVRGEGRFQVV